MQICLNDRLEQADKMYDVTQPIAKLVATTETRSMLCVIRGDEGYGVRRAILSMVNNLSTKGVTVRFVAMNSGPFTEEIARLGCFIEILRRQHVTGLEATGWKYFERLTRLLGNSIAASRVLCRAIRTIRPEWIHICQNTLLISAALAGWRTSTPVYWYLQGTIRKKLPFGLQALGYRMLCRTFRVHTLPNSKHTAESLGDRSAKLRVLYPGSDSDLFSPTAEFQRIRHEDLDLDPQVPTFLIAARVVPDKAQDRVIRATIDLYNSGLRLSLLIVGGPIESSFYKSLLECIRVAGAKDYIRMIGSVNDPRPYFALSDIVVNSRTAAEPFGLSIVEGMLMERPVLAYALGGPSETVLDGITGWLIPDPSIEGYAQGIRRALADRSRWRQMGARARARAIKCFSLERMCQSYLQIVDSNRMALAQHAASSNLQDACTLTRDRSH